MNCRVVWDFGTYFPFLTPPAPVAGKGTEVNQRNHAPFRRRK